MSSVSDGMEKGRVVHAGGNGFLVKPIRTDVLHSLCAQLNIRVNLEETPPGHVRRRSLNSQQARKASRGGGLTRSKSVNAQSVSLESLLKLYEF